MIEAIKTIVKEYRNRVKYDEVVDRLSFSTWKTCNRVLEEILAKREENDVELPVPSEDAWISSPKVRTRMLLSHLLLSGIAETKFSSELTETEHAWASRSDSDADEREEEFLATMDKELLLYRFTQQGGKRVHRENEPTDVAVTPVVFGFHGS